MKIPHTWAQEQHEATCHCCLSSAPPSSNRKQDSSTECFKKQWTRNGEESGGGEEGQRPWIKWRTKTSLSYAFSLNTALDSQPVEHFIALSNLKRHKGHILSLFLTHNMNIELNRRDIIKIFSLTVFLGQYSAANPLLTMWKSESMLLKYIINKMWHDAPLW